MHLIHFTDPIIQSLSRLKQNFYFRISEMLFEFLNIFVKTLQRASTGIQLKTTLIILHNR